MTLFKVQGAGFVERFKVHGSMRNAIPASQPVECALFIAWPNLISRTLHLAP
jgi:hypothetical protein